MSKRTLRRATTWPRCRFLRWVLSSGLLLMCAFPGRAETLQEGFRCPPHEYSMVAFWSWNGRLDRATLRRQIDQFVDKGVYGAFMHARAGIDTNGTPYFSTAWWDAVGFCVDYGKSAGFSPWIYDEDKWPSGAAGGRTIARSPERNVQKALHRVEQRVTGPRPIHVAIPGARYVVAARIVGDNELDPNSLTDISGFMDEAGTETVSWPCPPGDWLIAGYLFGPYGEGVNYLNRETVRDFIDITHEAYAARIGPALGSTVPGVFFDEIMNDAGKNLEYVVWVEGFEERFRAMKGYDLPPRLPALTYDVGSDTPKIRCDYYDVYTTLYEEAWFEQIADWCADHQLMLTGHTVEDLNRYITQGDYMRTQRHLQIPMTDNEDFRYTWPRTIGVWKPKQIASVAQLYGKPMTGVEAMGGAGWSFTLESARYGFNMLAAYGIDFFVPHLFHYAQDTPEQVDDWPNSWFYRNPYWKYFKTFADHGSRLSYMLRGGEPVADVAVLYPQANQWAGYGPGTTQETMERLVDAQIDVNLIDTDSLLGASIDDGRLIVGDLRFGVLVVPGIRCIRRSEAEKVAAFAKAGGLVVVHDRFPTDSVEAGRDDPVLMRFREALEQANVSPMSLDDTVTYLTKAVDRDVLVSGNAPSPLRYRHVRRDGYDIYWIANDDRAGGAWRIRFRATGTPERWQPEDGSITPVDAYVREGNHIECTVALDGWQGCFIVFDQATVAPEGGTEIIDTNLDQSLIITTDTQQITVSGRLPPGISVAHMEARLHTGEHAVVVRGDGEVEAAPNPIALDGRWEFLPVGHQLDDAWHIDVDSTDLAIPVMRVHWERSRDSQSRNWADPAFNDRHWKTIKVLDALHANEGAGRYRSRWEGGFISYFPHTPFDIERFFAPVIGGEGLKCRKTFLLPPDVTHGWIAVACPSPFRILLNGTAIAAGPGGKEAQDFELAKLRPGESTLVIEAEDATAVLAEGAFLSEYGDPVSFRTDESWDVALDNRDWCKAWMYVRPPERPFGEPAHPREPQLPDVVWYRQELPPGAVAVSEPSIEGTWTAWADGEPLSFRDGEAHLPKNAPFHLLAVRVALGDNDRGLMKPVTVRCESSMQPLGSWTNANLAWYSGRALYSTEFRVSDAYCRDGVDLTLDLGKVCYNAELWLNGNLVGTRIWPPYRVDVTGHVKPGKNRLTVVVANLLANRMFWDIFDDAKTNLTFRRWHDSNLRREGWCFESGLIGPVRIIPSREVRLMARVK